MVGEQWNFPNALHTLWRRRKRRRWQRKVNTLIAVAPCYIVWCWATDETLLTHCTHSEGKEEEEEEEEEEQERWKQVLSSPLISALSPVVLFSSWFHRSANFLHIPQSFRDHNQTSFTICYLTCCTFLFLIPRICWFLAHFSVFPWSRRDCLWRRGSSPISGLWIPTNSRRLRRPSRSHRIATNLETWKMRI